MFYRVLVFLILVFLLYRLIKSMRQNKLARGDSFQGGSSSSLGEDLVEDPACHTYIPISQACKKEISGITYYFCSEQCYGKYILEKTDK
jgi:YHS domain-containing protein